MEKKHDSLIVHKNRVMKEKNIKRVKPNGKPFGTFIISIDDGWVEYSFDLSPRRKKICIDDIWQAIRKKYRVKDVRPKERSRHF